MAEQPMPTYAYEDFHEGRTFELGPIEVTAGEIVEFAREFDPQPMHMDEAAGKASVLGGLAASGWHMAALMMRMMADSFLLESTSEGAPGIDVMQWKRPLLAGDTVGGTSTVTARRPSGSRKGLGLVTMRHDLFNQRGELVLTSSHTGFLRMRDAEVA